MKAYILSSTKINKHLLKHLKKDFEISSNIDCPDKDIKKLSLIDLTLNISYCDVIILLDLDILEKTFSISDANINFDEKLIQNFKECLWISAYTNDKFDYYIDKYNLNHINISLTNPYFMISKLAISDLLLNKILEDTDKLLHQTKVLIMGYSDTSKIISEKLVDNKIITVITDRFLKSLVEAKNDGLGILLKEDLKTSPIDFDFIIIDDEKLINFLPNNDNQKVFYIDYKESNDKSQFNQIKPSQEIECKYQKVVGESLASSIKKEVRNYYRGI